MIQRTALVVPALVVSMLVPSLLLWWSPRIFSFFALGTIGLLACGALYLVGRGVAESLRNRAARAASRRGSEA
jgi:hypothetical protein